MKKVLSLILSIMMLATFMPMMAFAETTEDTTDILTSRGLDYTPYEADCGDAHSVLSTLLLDLRKDQRISGTKRNYVETPPYVCIDLGRACDLTSVLTFANGSVHRSLVTIKYSNDKVEWTDASVTRQQFNKNASTNTYDSAATYANNFVFNESVKARYLKVTIVGYSSDKSVALTGLNVYGTLPSATKLSSLTVENATLGAEFDADVAEYTVEISTYENMPVVSATAETEGATVTITQATAETMKATVAVSYEGEETRTYTINFAPPSIPAMTSINYTNGVLSWGIPTHTNLVNDGSVYSWINADSSTVAVPCIQVDVYDENESLVESIDVNHETSKIYLTHSCYLKAFIDEAGTYKVSAALKTDDGTLGEKVWIENVVIDDNKIVSLPENGATAKSKNITAGETEYTDATENLLSPEILRQNYFYRNNEGEVIIEFAAPAQVSSIMSHQCGYRVRGTYSYSLDGVTWTALEAGTDITVPGSSNSFKTTYSSSGYTYIPVVEGKEFVAKYIKYEHPSLTSLYAVNQLYINGKFADVNYTDLSVSAEAGEVTASVNGQYVINANPKTDGSAIMFVAFYKEVDGNNVMVSMSQPTTISGFSISEAVAKSVEVNAPTEAGTYVVKAFLFNNMNTIVPLVAAPEITITVQ